MIRVALILIVAVISIHETEGCSCQIPHPQAEICSNTIHLGYYVTNVENKCENRTGRDQMSGKSQRPLLAYHTSCKCSAETYEFAIKGRVKKEDIIPKKPGVNLANDPNLNFHWRRYLVRVKCIFKGKTLVKRNSLIYVFTNGNSGLCGVRFQINRTYLITATIVNKRIVTGLCAWNAPWKDLTRHQKISYKKGRYLKNCQCMVPNQQCSTQASKCYHLYGTCMKNSGGNCFWKKGPKIFDCLN